MAAYRSFLRAVISLEGTPGSSAAGLQRVATGAALTQVRAKLRTLRDSHQRMAGPVVFRPLVLQFSPASNRAELADCGDFSRYGVDHPITGGEKYRGLAATLVRVSAAAPWRVSEWTTTDRSACAGVRP